MRFPSSFLDRIRASLPLTEVIGEFVIWDRQKSQPSKGDLWACCPFHGEKSPSFHADDRRGRYHCFGCSASGDLFSFLMQKEGISFSEAVERLAQKAGIALPAEAERIGNHEEKRNRLLQVMELATEYFCRQLQSPEGKVAQDYLSKRGITDSVIADFRLGYASPSRSGLISALTSAGVSQEEMLETGVVTVGESGVYDRFRARVIFPIFGVGRKVIAFGGRTLSHTSPVKYLNSPETVLFQKRKSFYSGSHLRDQVRKAGEVIVVEGYLDVLSLNQAGMGNVLAALGTALTQEQLALLWRLCDEPVVCFDGDEAGFKAACRVVDLAIPHLLPGKSLRFALLPQGYDPDDLIRREGRAQMEKILQSALPLVDMLWRQEYGKQDLSTPERRAAFARRLRERARSVADPEVRRSYERELRERLYRMGSGAWKRDSSFRAGKEGAPSVEGAQWHIGGAPRGGQLAAHPLACGLPSLFSMREVVLLITVLNHPEVLETQIEAFAALDFSHQDLHKLRCAILDLVTTQGMEDSDALSQKLTEQGFGEMVTKLQSMVERNRVQFALPGGDSGRALKGFSHTFALHRKLSTLSFELDRVRQEFERDGSMESFQKLIGLKEEMNQIEGMESGFDK